MDIPNKPYKIMGIVNVTPDSFFDGGRFVDEERAVAHALDLAEEGADILDIGGASSRPGAAPVTPEEEAKRVVPVVRRLVKSFKGAISVDTTWASVAQRALDAGASWINDISAGRGDPLMATLAARHNCTMVLMHSRGTPQTMQTLTEYSDVVENVMDELSAAIDRFLDAGTARERIVIDPGVGFAKTADQNIALLNGLNAFVKMGYPVLVGTSRKSFVGHLTGREAADRLYGSLGSVASAFFRGARIFRVHDVAATLDFLKVVAAIETGPTSSAPRAEAGTKRG
jgi:dihydropteroate synthase